MQQDEVWVGQGFLDNRGFEINVGNAANIRSVLHSCDGIRLIVLVNYNSLKSDRGRGQRELMQILSDLFGTPEVSNEQLLSVHLCSSNKQNAGDERTR